MSQYFEVQAKHLQQQDNGLVKTTKTLLLIDALSFTEAEARITQELSGSRELVVTTIKRSNISEVVEVGDSDLWFKVKVTYSTADDESEKEKKITLYLLVNAADVTEAKERTEDHLSGMLVPFEVPSVVETKFAGVLHHDSAKPRERVTAPEPTNPNIELDVKNEEE
jgi:hypothetical protein